MDRSTLRISRLVLNAVLASSLIALTLAVPLARPAAAAVGGQVYLPNVTKTLGGANGWTTPIVVQNTGASPTDVALSFYRFRDGTLATTVKSPSLKPGQAWSFDPRSNSALPNDTQFAVVVQATTGQVAATVIEGSGSSWMAYAGTATGAATVYLPNITRNLGGPDGWNTPFIVQNIGTKATTASVSFYTFASGTLAKKIEKVDLQPGRSQAFLTWAIDGLADDTQYSVVVQAATPDAQLYAIVNEASGPMAMSYEGLLTGSDTVYLPNVLKYLGGTDHWYTPFIVQNLGASATSVTIDFYSFESGTLVTTLRGLVLEPGRSAPVDVRFTPAELSAGSYSVVVRGKQGSKLGAVVNEMDPGAGMAMSYLGIAKSEAQPSAYLPLVQKKVGNAGWSSPIVAQNLGASATDITLTLYDAAGGIAAQKVYPAVKPGAAAVYDPRFDRRLKNGTYSGLVQAAGSVSAIVNLSGAIAGDVAMAFTSTPGPQSPVPVLASTQKPIGASQFTLKTGNNVDLWIETSIDAATATRMVVQLDADAAQVQTDFGRQFATIPAIYVFASTASYTQGLQTLLGYSQATAQNIAKSSDALFHPKTQLTLANWGEISKWRPQSAVRHELTHAMTSQIIGTNPTLPAWLDEGLAFSEELTVPGSKWLAMQSRYGAASMAHTGMLIPIEGLSSPLFWTTRTGAAATYQYFESAQIVQMLRADVGQHGIVRILELMGGGTTFKDAYAAVAGRQFSDFAAAFPERAKALAPSYPGVVAVEDSPIGPGLSFMAYGFAPGSAIVIEVRSSTIGDVAAELTTIYGTRFHYLGTNWPAGSYNITVTSLTTTVSVVARKV